MGIIEHARDIAELVKKYNDQDLYERIVELREEILSLREENLQLREDVRKLTDAAAIQNQIVRHGNCYYRVEDTERRHPHCLACWDFDHKLVGLTLNRNSYGATMINCGICSARGKTS